MRYRIELEIPENKSSFILEFLKSISFIKKVKVDVIEKNEITNADVLQTIKDYESRKVTPTPMSLAELKAMINA